VKTAAKAQLERRKPSSTSDERLVALCLKGDQQAWADLIDKYKNLIYSIPLRYGASPEDASDIFQSVCLQLFAELPRLRKTAAFSAWLIAAPMPRVPPVTNATRAMSNPSLGAF